MVTAAMNVGVTETESFSRPAIRRWNGGFAGASRDPESDNRFVSSVA